MSSISSSSIFQFVISPLEAARHYASIGLAVFPQHSGRGGRCSCGNPNCESAGKHPVWQLVPHGFKDATTDLVIIEQWWASMPDANIGIATGERSGIIVIDVDNVDSFEEAKAALPFELPYTPVQLSGSGRGYHFFFKYPLLGRRIASRRVGGNTGPELKADGGCITVTPSVHKSALPYRWLPSSFDLPLAEVPVGLLTLLNQSGSSEMTVQSGTTLRIANGHRNDTLFREASQFRRLIGTTFEQAWNHCSEINRSSCDPPLSDAEVRRVVENAWRHDNGETRYRERLTIESIDRSAEMDSQLATFAPRRLSDILADTTIPQRVWFVDDLLTPGLNMLFAKKGVGKSLFAQQMAGAISKGEDFLGRRTTQARVLYVSLELDQIAIKARGRDFNESLDNLEFNFEWPKADVGLHLLEQAAENYRVIIIDMLNSIVPGEMSTNGYEISEFFRRWRMKAKAKNCALVGLWHSGKSDRTDWVDGMIGSTGISAQCDVTIFLDLKRGHQHGTIRSGGNHGGWLESHVRFDYPRFTATNDPPPNEDLEPTLKQRILAAMWQFPNGCSPREVAAVLHEPGDTVAKAMSRLVRENKLVRRGIGLYHLPAQSA